MGASEQFKQTFDLERYMSDGVENVVKGILRATLKNPKEAAFMAKYARATREATKKRRDAEARGEHIPPFLICSITSECNLHCAGCYARANDECNEGPMAGQLTGSQWKSIFEEADDLGISFALLAGGEPMMRRDILEAAGSVPNILFPTFTNGTMMNNDYLKLFDRYRNIVPIFSIEGNETITDARRGYGIYKKLMKGMNSIQENGLVFGASVTVTTENLEEVFSAEFLDSLQEKGCKAVIFVEFVPVTDEAQELAPGDPERAYIQEMLMQRREEYPEMVLISFPGDEKTSGGCLAANRGFFHINAYGGAEPCPFSPYSDINVIETSLKDAMDSKLFKALQSEEVLKEDHAGGCVLFERRDVVEALLARSLEEQSVSTAG